MLNMGDGGGGGHPVGGGMGEGAVGGGAHPGGGGIVGAHMVAGLLDML